MPNLISLTIPSLQILSKNSDGGISNFRISGQSCIKVNCHNSRISDDIDMKPGAVTRLDSRDKTKLKKFHDDVMSTNCDVTVIFSNLWPIFFNSDALHARLNSHYEAWSYKKRSTKRLKHTGNLIRKSLQLKDVY